MTSHAARRGWRRLVADDRSGWLVALVAFVVYSTYALARHAQHLTAGYDLGIFHQVVRAYSRFEAPVVPLKDIGYNVLGDHFHPILATLAPLYWVWPDPRMLLLAQAALVAVSVLPVHAFARRHWGSGAGLAMAVGYAFGWPLQGLVNFDFHEIAFAAPLLAFVVDGLDRRSDRRLLAAALPLLLVREDLGAVVALLGVVRAFRRPRPAGGGRVRGVVLGVLLVALGAFQLWFATRVVLPHFNPSGTFAYWTYTQLGDNVGEALGFVLAHPLRTLAIFLTPLTKSATLAWLLLPLLALPLRSPYVLLTAPLLAQRMFSSRALLWEPNYHYNAPLWPILVLAAIDGAQRLRRTSWRAAARRWLPRVLVATFVVGTLAWLPPFPLSRMVYGVAFRETDRTRQQEAIVALVPPGTCVGADDRVVPMLLRTNVVAQARPETRWADYIVLDAGAKDPGYLLPPTGEVRATAEQVGYVLAESRGDLELWQAPRDVSPRDSCRP